MVDKDYKIKYKNESLLMKILGFITKPFCPKFMTTYTTTVGKTIYLPTKFESFAKRYQIMIIMNEKKHIEQYKKYFPFYGLMYLFLPFPILFAYFRLKFECEAYAINIDAKLITYDEVIESLSGPTYFWTWYSKEKIKKLLEHYVEELRSKR